MNKTIAEDKKITVKHVPIGDLKAADYNPRRWDKEAERQLKESISRFGIVDPLLANSAEERKNIVIGGHFRLSVMKELGIETVPVVYVNIPDIEKEKELNIRLNKNTGEFDWGLLAKFDEAFLVDLMDQKALIEIRTFSQKFTNSPSEKFMLMILCSTAKLENDNKSENVKRGLRTRCEQGLRPSMAPTGYLNEKRKDKACEVIVDPVRAPIIRQIFEKVANEQWSGRRIHHWLRNEAKFKTTAGKHLSVSNIFMILKKTFYYGLFEYPVGSGNWYTGQHTPIITKELYDAAQEQLVRSEINKNKDKDFAFTKLITCGLCGSGITACEKFKYQQNGNTHRYVYYKCTKAKNPECTGGYIKEEEIIQQIVKIFDTLDINELGVRQKFKDEIMRYNKFRRIALGKSREKRDEDEEFDAKAYAIYLLTEGSITEKRELLSNLKSRLILKDKVITLRLETE